MQLKLDNTNIQQIKDLKHATAAFSITIEKAVEIEKLTILDEVLKNVGNMCKLVLVVDLRKKAAPELIRNLEVLPLLSSVKRLAILSNSSEKIEDLESISTILDLREIALSGFFDKDISLQPLEKFENLSSLELDFGANKKQSKIINSFNKLTGLSVPSIDLKDLSQNLDLIYLKITKTLKNHELLGSLFPNLKNLQLNDCKSIDGFNFINELKSLEKLSLNYMKQLVEFPNLVELKNIIEIELLEAKNLTKIDPLLSHSKLKTLSITDAENLTIEDFKKLSMLEHLKIVYTRFKSPSKAKDFDSLALQKNWTNKHPSVLARVL